MTAGNRYANDWNEYSKTWETNFGERYGHLGEEWNDSNRDAFYFATYAARWLRPNATVLEIGPGGGKWTVQLAPKVERVIALDVSEEMLRRTRARCESLALTNVEYVLGNSHDFQPVADQSVDFLFSYDVFVHIAMEDTWAYVQEMARVLKPESIGVCHHAINTTHRAWDRIEQLGDWYRAGAHTLGQYYYYSPTALAMMYEHCGFKVVEQHIEGSSCTCVFVKADFNVVPRLEQLLARFIGVEAGDSDQRMAIINEIRSLHDVFAQQLNSLLENASAETDVAILNYYASAIRQLWRGF